MTLRITGGEYRGRRLRVPNSADLRPTSDRVRGAIFSILGPDLLEDARVLDLYAGTGALGIEGLSRGAAWADFVEANGRRAQQLRANLQLLELSGSSKVHTGKVETVVDRLDGGYDLVMADPPYSVDDLTELMEILSKKGTLANESVVMIEHRHDTVIAEVHKRLELVTRRRYGDTSVSIYRAGAIDD